MNNSYGQGLAAVILAAAMLLAAAPQAWAGCGGGDSRTITVINEVTGEAFDVVVIGNPNSELVQRIIDDNKQKQLNGVTVDAITMVTNFGTYTTNITEAMRTDPQLASYMGVAFADAMERSSFGQFTANVMRDRAQ